ncbi:PspA/IM30 family protein [Parasulfitobacter algicola]|uniref:PspA/IM30 family protein n=1 Tax=Parasulfitobacter algicola TaxID=2614809 RepID=A0ABX2IZP4_9RHOB|nr:PspA/IM30 family protein [Sulfitobacter algicola]NSX56173.1 PspA/IM30 family protein [Sulfitobacter algicola]
MFATFRTLITGANVRAEERVRDTYAIELIDQKIREAEASLKAAKGTLASIIQRHRAEMRQVDGLKSRVEDMIQRAIQALEAEREDLASEAAHAIANMENELEIRQQTVERLDHKIIRLRQSVEAGQRRIIDLKQGAITARAVRREQDMQSKLNTTITSTSSIEEAEDLIARVLQRDDPFEQSEILHEIDQGLNHETLASRMADQGFGSANKSTAKDVLDRLKAKK